MKPLVFYCSSGQCTSVSQVHRSRATAFLSSCRLHPHQSAKKHHHRFVVKRNKVSRFCETHSTQIIFFVAILAKICYLKTKIKYVTLICRKRTRFNYKYETIRRKENQSSVSTAAKNTCCHLAINSTLYTNISTS